MKSNKYLLATAVVLGLIFTTTQPALAYSSSSGSTTCSGTRTVSIFGTQNDIVRHWYYATGVM